MRITAFKFSIALMLGSLCSAYAQQNPNRGDGDLHILPVQGNIYMLVGAGANITVSAGYDGTLLVDTGSEQMTDRVLAAVKQLAITVTGTPYPPSPCVGLRCPGGAGSGAVNHWGWSSPAINTIIVSHARSSHRWRHDCVFSLFRRHQRGGCVFDHKLSGN